MSSFADKIKDSFAESVGIILTFIPIFLAFLVIWIIGWIIAKSIRNILAKLLKKMSFDNLVERGGLSQFLGGRISVSDVLVKITYYALMLFVLQMAFGVFGPNAVSDLISQIISFIPRAIVAVTIIVVAAAIASAVRDLTSNALSNLSYGDRLARLISYFIIGLGVIAALNQVNIATTVTMPVLITVLATIGGIAVVGVGGGLIRPMQQRWEGWINTISDEAGKVKLSDKPNDYEYDAL